MRRSITTSLKPRRHWRACERGARAGRSGPPHLMPRVHRAPPVLVEPGGGAGRRDVEVGAQEGPASGADETLHAVAARGQQVRLEVLAQVFVQLQRAGAAAVGIELACCGACGVARTSGRRVGRGASMRYSTSFSTEMRACLPRWLVTVTCGCQAGREAGRRNAGRGGATHVLLEAAAALHVRNRGLPRMQVLLVVANRESAPARLAVAFTGAGQRQALAAVAAATSHEALELEVHLLPAPAARTRGGVRSAHSSKHETAKCAHLLTKYGQDHMVACRRAAAPRTMSVSVGSSITLRGAVQ